MAMADMVSISAAFALVIAAMRCIAEAQIVPLESVFWLANLATGVFCGATIFAATFAVLCATFSRRKGAAPRSKSSSTPLATSNA